MGFNLESGLHYNWHRHYDPSTGRYLQPDPLGMPDGPSRYAYALNSPQMAVDPDGLQSRGILQRSRAPIPGLLVFTHGTPENLKLADDILDFCRTVLGAHPMIPVGIFNDNVRKTRNFTVKEKSRKTAKDKTRHANGGKVPPIPPGLNGKQLKDRIRKQNKPESHPDSNHPEKHFHGNDKGRHIGKKGSNPHVTYPKR